MNTVLYCPICGDELINKTFKNYIVTKYSKYCATHPINVSFSYNDKGELHLYQIAKYLFKDRKFCIIGNATDNLIDFYEFKSFYQDSHIMTLDYFIDIKTQEDIDLIFQRLLKLVIFS